jgi:hypothetical protein
MRFRLAMGLVAVLAASTGCAPRGDSSDKPAAETSQATASHAEIPAPRPSAIWFEPANLRACARPEKISVHWDATPFATVKTVEIVAINPAGRESVFLYAGRKGSRETGAWMRAGSVMVLRNKADNVELARATVGSIACN